MGGSAQATFLVSGNVGAGLVVTAVDNGSVCWDGQDTDGLMALSNSD